MNLETLKTIRGGGGERMGGRERDQHGGGEREKQRDPMEGRMPALAWSLAHWWLVRGHPSLLLLI
jgi:hypothetical protein